MTNFAHRVLVGVDPSVGSREAVDTAIELCRATGAELHLVHVKLTSAVLRGRPGGSAGQQIAMRDEGEELLRRSPGSVLVARHTGAPLV